MRSHRNVLAPSAVLCVGLIISTRGAAQSASVVMNPAPNPNAPSFRISPQPLFTVGGLNDDPHYELVRVADAEVTPAGKLIVATRGTGRGGQGQVEVRVFGPVGRYERTIGRYGQGPGEFNQIARVWARGGDSIAVYDNGQQRVSVFDGAGRLGRTISSVVTGRGLASEQCCFDDWSYLISGRPPSTPFSVRDRQGPRDTVPWSIGRAGTTDPPRRILRLEDGDAAIRIGTGLGAGSNFMMHVPFSRTVSIQITAGEIVYGMPDTYEYRVYTKTGALARIVRADVAPVPVTKSMVAAERDFIGKGAVNPSQLQKAFDGLTLPQTIPAYHQLVAERDGTVWVRGFAGTSITPQWWARFDRTGKLLGTISIPDDRTVVRFTNGYVVLGHTDTSEGVVMLYVHRIEPIR
jgi:hypothetical protein